MNNTTARQIAAPRPLLAVATRIAAAAAVLALVSAAWVYAGQASRHAVDSTQAVLTPGVMHVTLPRVQIVAHRDAADRMAAGAAMTTAQ
jgi:hypothetical protein